MLEAALLARKRTSVKSPFNALVLEKYISEGQLALRQKPIATLVDTDEFWIQVSVPLDKLRRLSFPSEREKTTTPAEVVLDMGNARKTVRKAEAYKLHGELDPKGRMAKVLFRLPDPLNLKQK